MFWNVEGRTGLYIFFKTVCDYYGLIPDDNYTIPPEAEGDGTEPSTESRSAMLPTILKREPSGPGPEDSDNSTILESLSDHNLSTAGTTKRHRHSPSVGATAVSTVVEENEEEEDQPKDAARPVTQLFELTPSGGTAQPTEPGPTGDAEDEDEDENEDDDEADAEDADEPVSAAPEGDAAEEGPEKQSASDEAEADPTPEIEEKQSKDAPTATEADDASDDKVSAPEGSDAKEPDEEPSKGESGASEGSTTSAEPDKVETDVESAAKPEELPAEEDKTGD